MMPPFRHDLCTNLASTSSRCSASSFRGAHWCRHRARQTPRALALEQAQKDPFQDKTTYQDNLVDKVFVRIFSSKMAEQLGPAANGRAFAPGYQGFVDLSKEIMKGRNSQQQREVIRNILQSLLPPTASERFRKWFPFSKIAVKWSAETNARITTVFFKWLVGPMEIEEKDIDFQGGQQKWKSGVKIKKCRYLEESGCVGLCMNLCKRPTEEFFANEFGLPLTMNPNLEDLSCEMIFGQFPPKFSEDPCYNAPCFPHVCTIGERDASVPCPKIDTERRRRKDKV